MAAVSQLRSLLRSPVRLSKSRLISFSFCSNRGFAALMPANSSRLAMYWPGLSPSSESCRRTSAYASFSAEVASLQSDCAAVIAIRAVSTAAEATFLNFAKVTCKVDIASDARDR